RVLISPPTRRYYDLALVDFARTLRERLAHFGGHQVREFVLALSQARSGGAHERGAAAERGRAPDLERLVQARDDGRRLLGGHLRSEEHTSELQSREK